MLEHFLLMFIRHAAVMAFLEHRIEYDLAASVDTVALARVRVLERELALGSNL